MSAATRLGRAAVHALLAAAACAVAVAASAAATSPPLPAGARPVPIALTLHYEMQCGYPGPGPVLVDFPAQVRLPARLARAAVLVDGKPALSVARVGASRVVIGLAPRPRIMCDVIGPGRLTIAFGLAANLGAPASPGTYRIVVRRAQLRLLVPLVVVR